MPRIFLPYVEVLWKHIPASLEEIKDAGFDGVECHLIGRLRAPARVRELQKEVAQLDLGIHFHQGWSWETGQRNLHNVVLRFLGALVPVGMPFYEQVRDIADPVVVYGSLADEPSGPNYIYQTASEHVHGKTYAMTFTSFVNAVKSSRLPVVFDTQHILEWCLNKGNVLGLPTDTEAIGQMVDHLWQEFCPFVREIHLCDFNPSLGTFRGRNVFLGDGVFPLKDFCANVRASGWDGTVTPEVSPQHLQGKDKLQMLRERVNRLFS